MTTLVHPAALLVLAFLPSSEGAVAEITDVEGRSTQVSDLRAHYRATGVWVGEPPTRQDPTLFISIRMKEGRETRRERIEVPLAEIERIVIDEWTDRKMGKRPSRLTIAKRGGGVIRISKPKAYTTFDFLEDTVEETGPTGVPVRAFRGCFYSLVAGDAFDSAGVNGGTFELAGFKGRSGETDVEFPLATIQSISLR